MLAPRNHIPALVAAAAVAAVALMGGGVAGDAHAQSSSDVGSIQAMIDAAPAGGTVAVPPGIYGDANLTVDKALTLTSGTGQPGAAILTGESRIVVSSSDVTIRGLSFRDTACMQGGTGALVEINADVDRAGIAIKNNVFRDTCGAAVQSAGNGSLGVEIAGNTLVNVGLKMPPAGDGSRASGGAIALAHGPGQRIVGGEISGNHIDGAASAGVVVFNAGGMRIVDNYIADTPASAVVLARGPGPEEVRVDGNTVVNASNGPAPAAGAAVYSRLLVLYKEPAIAPPTLPDR